MGEGTGRARARERSGVIPRFKIDLRLRGNVRQHGGKSGGPRNFASSSSKEGGAREDWLV